MPDISSIVWTDYRLAILFTVVLPLILLAWATFERSDAIQKLLLIYWRVSSLLAITVYLLIGALSIGFLSGWLARILIPISLWYWVDINEDIRDQPPNPLKLSTQAWRWAVSIYCAIGVLGQIPVLRCAFLNTQQLRDDAFCNVWLAPPWLYQQTFHANTRPFFLAYLGIAGLIVYTICLAYFIFFRLGKRKRSALEN